MKFRIFCEVSGGVTGYRYSYLKKWGKAMLFSTQEAAQAECDRLKKKMNGPHARATFSYSVEENYHA